jgi:hypothetical protein
MSEIAPSFLEFDRLILKKPKQVESLSGEISAWLKRFKLKLLKSPDSDQLFSETVLFGVSPFHDANDDY